MAHVALYREWRPLTFDEVVEQAHVVTALRHAVVTGQIAHAYLFAGTRGTGKTTVAKIFARAINCLSPNQGNPCNQCAICTGALNGSLLDIVEMDAASNNSVDTIRRIVDEVVFMPSQARFKVYIVDEVHMLSTGAFNALLKTLEEPPAHAVFILATTEPYRIPATILSRCQRYEFRRIPLPSLVGRLQEIATADGIAIEPEALDAIARLAEGGMRDAISLLDQVRMTVAAGHPVSRDDVLRMTGVADDELMARISQALLTGRAAEILAGISQLVMTGRDPARFLIDLAAYCRNLLVVAVTPDPTELLQVTREQLQRLQAMAHLADSARLVTLVRELSALHGELRWSSDSRTTLEIGLLRLMSDLPASSPAMGTGPGAGTNASTGTNPGAGKNAASGPEGVASTGSASAAGPDVVPAARQTPVAGTAAASAAPAIPASVPADLKLPGKPAFQAVTGPGAKPAGADEAPLPEPPPEDDLDSYYTLPAEPPHVSRLRQTQADSRAEPPAAAAIMPALTPAAAQPVPEEPASADAVPMPVMKPITVPVTVPVTESVTESVTVPATPPAVPDVPATPSVAPATEPAAPSAPVAPEAAASPVAGKSGDPFVRTPAAGIEPNDAARWQAIQDQLASDGQMTLYLFSRPAAFSFCGGELHLLFSEKDKINYQELKEPQNIKALRSAATRIVGSETPVVVRLATDPEAEALRCPVPQEPAWISRVRAAADAFGIPVKMEEN